MGRKPFPHRTLRVFLRVLFLLGAGPATGAAQATGGFTTALAMATEAAVRAVTTTVYPVGLYAGRDEDGIPRYIQRPFSDEERRLLREHFGIEEPGRLYLSDTTTEAYLNYDTERDPGAGRRISRTPPPWPIPHSPRWILTRVPSSSGCSPPRGARGIG
jgi:hypothetical protein